MLGWRRLNLTEPQIEFHDHALLPYGQAGLNRSLYRAWEEHFEQWLEEHAPLRKEKVLNRIREMRGGKLYNSQWGQRMRGEGKYYESLKQLFEVQRKKMGLTRRSELSCAHFVRPSHQLTLF